MPSRRISFRMHPRQPDADHHLDRLVRLDRLFIARPAQQRPASVSDLARPLHIASPSALNHLAVLEAGGIVRSEKVGRVRTYRIDPNAFTGVKAWVSERKARWNSPYSRLERYLNGDSP